MASLAVDVQSIDFIKAHPVHVFCAQCSRSVVLSAEAFYDKTEHKEPSVNANREKNRCSHWRPEVFTDARESHCHLFNFGTFFVSKAGWLYKLDFVSKTGCLNWEHAVYIIHHPCCDKSDPVPWWRTVMYGVMKLLHGWKDKNELKKRGIFFKTGVNLPVYVRKMWWW